MQSAQTILAGVEPARRTQNVLLKNDEASLLALFEALCCPEYHTSEEQLAKHFNYVFEQVQSKKPLKIVDTVPAMAQFLFSSDPLRLRFARNSWEKIETNLNSATFDWVVHDALSQAILSLRNPTPSDLQRFWNGFLLMLQKMDMELITHSLRGMEVQPSVFTLILEHLASSSDKAMDLIIKSLRLLIQKAPKDFWSALGTVSAKTVAELIFRSKGYHKLLYNDTTFESVEDSPATNWIPDFLESQDAIHQVDACRSVVSRLFKEFQTEALPEIVKKGCFYAGLNALFVTLRTFNNPKFEINPSNSLIAINNIVELVHEHKPAIIRCADTCQDPQLKRMAMLVLGGVLALDCKAIRAEFVFLENGQAVERTPRAHSQSFWEDVLDIFRPGNLELAKFIVAATRDVTGVDQLLPINKKAIQQMPKSHVHFNEDYHQLMDNIARVFNRLSDFNSPDLKQLLNDPDCGLPLLSALLSPHEGTYEATIEIIKAMTDEIGKEEAMTNLLDQGLGPALQYLNIATARLSTAGNFGPMPHLIKTGGDILQGLCGSTGVLRARPGMSKKEQEVVGTWWIQQWKIIDRIFSCLEAWSPRVSATTAEMQDFCRDAMEYAEALFDKYAVVASALQNSSTSDVNGKRCTTKVLNAVCANIDGLTKLLRLRDVYLVGVITSLLGKLLRSLGQYSLEVPEVSSNYIKDACKRENELGFRRTNLTNQQKAELQRVLYEHQGLEIVEKPQPVKAVIKKQGTIDSWSSSAAGKVHEPRLPVRSQQSGWSASTTNQSNFSSIINPAKQQTPSKQIFAQKAAKEKSDKDRNSFLEGRRKVEEERQKQKANAIAKAQALRAPVGGSGLKNIGGIVGKDHDPIRSEIMVGSSDEDSDDDDDDVDDSNSLVKLRKGTSSKMLEYEESKRRALKQMAQGPVKKTKVQRSAKDLRARVEPNMDMLYVEILNWNLFHRGDDPPSKMQCRAIANKFLDLGLYKETFAPLLISEVWRSLVTARDENQNRTLEITILNRLSVDKFMEVSAKMPMTMDRALKFAERDIVLLSTSKDPINNPQEANCLARVDRTNRKKDIIEVTFRISRNIDQGFLSKLGPKSKVFAVKIADMTTTQREYAALSSLEYYDLCNEVMEAKPSPLQTYSTNKTNDMASIYALNQGQAKAILSAVDNDGFTLIQG